MSKRRKKKEEKAMSVYQIEAIGIAQQYAENKRAREILHDQAQELKERLIQLMQYNASVDSDIVLDILGEEWHVKLVTKRHDRINNNGVIRRVALKVMKLAGINKPARQKIATSLADELVELMRKDGVMVSKLKKMKWGERYIKDKEVVPYIHVYETVEL